MNAQRIVFSDFHLHGASAPEWNQRYLQMSRGVMRSSLTEWSAGDAHLFGKWMSERVVQQGGLPMGQVCFALLGAGSSAQPMRAQGREFGPGDLLILRGGEEFEFHRPGGIELLSATFDASTFSAYLDRSGRSDAQRKLSRPGVLGFDGAALGGVRQAMRAQLAGARSHSAPELMQLIGELLSGPATTPSHRRASLAAGRLVTRCQGIALAEAGERPAGVAALGARVGASRRTLQNSFRQVTGTSPLVYLRNLRLNAIRHRLLATPAGAPTVTEAACEAGFDHLGHFAAAYKALFGEAPSHTRRLAPRPDRQEL